MKETFESYIKYRNSPEYKQKLADMAEFERTHKAIVINGKIRIIEV